MLDQISGREQVFKLKQL